LGTLREGRFRHGSILLDDEIMVIGGYSSQDFPVKTDLEIEIWNLTNETDRTTNQIASSNDYTHMGLYIVPYNFCTI